MSGKIYRFCNPFELENLAHVHVVDDVVDVSHLGQTRFRGCKFGQLSERQKDNKRARRTDLDHFDESLCQYQGTLTRVRCKLLSYT